MSDGQSNPLIAQAEDSTEWYSGVTLFETVSDTYEAISSGSWVEAGLGVVGVGLEVAAVVVDPFGTLAGFGVGWLIEHVEPLQEALNWVAGDPDQIEAYAKTWSNVSEKIGEAAEAHKQAVSQDISEWQGATATAYRARAAETADALAAATKAAEAASQAIQMAGGVVAAVRMVVRDIVAQAVGRLAVWAAEAIFTLGVGTPVVATQAAVYVAKTLNTISTLFRKLASTMSKLTPLLRKLKDAFAAIIKKLTGKQGGTPSGARPSKKTTNDTDTTPAGTDTKPANTDTKPAGTETKPTDTPSKQPDSPNNSSDGTNPAGTNSPSGTDNPKPSTPKKSNEGVGDEARTNNPKDTQKPEDVNSCGDPVDAATGEFLLPETDVELPGVLNLELRRRHRSSYRFGRWFGPSWSATLDMRVVVDQLGVTFVGEDGILLAYPHTAPDIAVLPSGRSPRWPMTRTESGGYRVSDPDREITWHFTPESTHSTLSTLLGDYPITAITDRHHNEVRFHYDTDGTPTEVTHSGGYRVRVDTADGRVTALSVLGRDAYGTELVTRVREFGYEAGELVSITNGVGAITHYTYDDHHRMLSWTDSNGNQMHNVYDVAGRVIRQHGTDGIMSAQFGYDTLPDGSGTRTTYTNSLGAVTVFEFDSDLRLRDTIDPTGARTRTDYNDDRKPVRVIAADGAITRYEYNDDGDLTTVTRPDEVTITVEYQARNRPGVIRDADGSVRGFDYDEQGNLTAIVDSAGLRTVHTHHPSGAVASITESTGARTVIEVNAAGLPITIVDPHGGVSRIGRDHFGRPVTVIDPLNAITRYQWSPEGKLLCRTDSDGHTATWEWDGEGNLLTHIDRAGGQTRFTYGAFDLLTARTEPDQTVTRYAWDTERQMVAAVNPLGHTWRYSYDPAGRVVSEVDYTGAQTRYDFDVAGRVTAVTAATGITRRNRYDILGRLTEVRAETGEWIRYTHDVVGRPLTATSGVGNDRTHTVESTYTAEGRLAAQRVDDRPPMHFQYDDYGRRIGRTNPSGATTTWQHDPTGRITGLTTDGHTIAFAHDAVGRSTGWRLGAITVEQTLSSHGFVTQQQVHANPAPPHDPSLPPGPTLLRRDDYTWRPDGYIATQTTTRPDTRPVVRDYTLDAIGRVTTITANGRTTERYTYDALSNITNSQLPETASVTTGPTTTSVTDRPDFTTDNRREYRNNLLIRDGRTRYHYDAAGRLIRKEATRLSRKPDIWHYRYNAFDQLIDVYTPDRQWWHYTYDAFGRRTSKQHLVNDGTVLEYIDYTWDNTHLLEQSIPHGVVRWNYRPDTYTPITQTADQTTIDREFFAILTDLVGTPTQLIDLTGNTAAHAAADLWGRTVWIGVADTPLRFPGQQYDSETGLHYNIHRHYDPTTGRFLSQDPLGLAPSPNPAAYPHNPTAWIDPLGLTCENSSTVPESRSERRTLYHYTTEEKLEKILNSQELWASRKADNPKDARYGDGQYLSDIEPGTRTAGQLARAFLGTPWGGQKFSHFVEIDVTDLRVVQGRDGVYVILNDGPLDLAGRIIRHGKN
ncbi:HYD1 signature containing ADP-ribosyltransferase family protein [Nocardia sp. NPDC050793]|uniref:HYD1 signature containing ADP-ribosyltransferase family protein n=1 Tax=Nocardia sp. NPDC050793 TaxID=3155159 RepID=UPI0033D56EA9